MEQVIDRILNIDKEAEDRIISANSQKEQIIKQAKLEALKINSDCINRADNRIDKVEKIEKENADKRISQLSEETSASILKLDDLFNKNKSAWEKEIFKRIVGE